FHCRGSATVVPTRALAEELAKLGIGNACLLRRAVDTALFHPRHRDAALRERWGVAADDPVVIYVGRIAPEKNLDLAIQAFRKLQARVPNARYVWVGDGPARAELAAANPDFIFAGTQLGHELARHYASADIFLFPSVTETFGNVTLEAMASGLAVLAYDYAAARQYLRHGASALLAPYDDAAAFCEMAARLAGDSALRARLRGE